MATTTVKLNHAGMAALLKSAGVRSAIAPYAERVLASAKANAPVDTGAYRDGLHIEHDTTDRAVERVVGGSDHDLIVEANHGTLASSL